METQTLVASVAGAAQEPASPGKVEKKSGKRIGYHYIVIKSLKESQKNDVVKCLYIKSLTNFGLCVIKEGTRGDSKDEHGRDIRDRLKWQKKLHEQLQGKMRIPRCYGSFEENGNYYLVIECIKGVPLYKLIRSHAGKLRPAFREKNELGRQLLKYMRKMALLISGMHREQIVHRDITPNNFMLHGNKVGLIDFELSYSLDRQFPSPPFKLGTYGYMSPEQLRTETPTKAQDVYALAGVFLFMITGISTNKILCDDEEALRRRIDLFVPIKNLAVLLQACMAVDPARRPVVEDMIGVLDQVMAGPAGRSAEEVVPAAGNAAIREVVQGFLKTLHSDLLCDGDRGWFSEHQKMPARVDKNSINKAWYASLFNGAAGIIYFLSHAKRAGLDVSALEPGIQQGIALIRKRYADRIEQASPGLLTGASGIAVALAEAMDSGLLATELEYVDWIRRFLEKPSMGLNYAGGVAGQGLAHFRCGNYVPETVTLERCTGYVRLLLQLQNKDGSWYRDDGARKKRATKGFQNGVAGIVVFLLAYAGRYKDEAAWAAAGAGLSWLMRKGTWRKGRVFWKASNGKVLAPWVREGAAGIALAFVKGFEMTGNPAYREYAYGALHNHDGEVMDSNLGLADGLSGLGEVYLNAWSVFQDEQWLQRADWIAKVLLHIRKDEVAAGPYWLVEGERKPVADLMTGNAGVAHFLLRRSSMQVPGVFIA